MGEFLDARVGQATASREVQMLEMSWRYERSVIDVIPCRLNSLDEHGQRIVGESLAIGEHQSFEGVASMKLEHEVLILPAGNLTSSKILEALTSGDHVS